MKYTPRFVFYYYDEFDTTFANIYDILVEASSPGQALAIGRAIVVYESESYFSPCEIRFVSLTENKRKGEIYVLSEDGNFVVLPERDYDKLPRRFCYNGETFFVVDKDRIPKMRFPEPH